MIVNIREFSRELFSGIIVLIGGWFENSNYFVWDFINKDQIGEKGKLGSSEFDYACNLEADESNFFSFFSKSELNLVRVKWMLSER